MVGSGSTSESDHASLSSGIISEWRRPARALPLFFGTLRAAWPTLAVGALVTIMLASANFISPASAAEVSLFCASIFIVSVYLHELGHLIVIRASSVQAVLVQRGMRLGILHPPLPSRREFIAALTGPIMGLAFCAILGLVLWELSITGFAIVALVVGGFHILSLLPGYGDGVSLFRAIAKMKESA